MHKDVCYSNSRISSIKRDCNGQYVKNNENNRPQAMNVMNVKEEVMVKVSYNVIGNSR